MRGLAGRAETVRAVRRAVVLAACAAALLGAAPARAEEGGILGFLSSAFGVGGGAREQAPAAVPAPSEGEQVRPLTVRRAPKKAQAGVGRARVAHGPSKIGPVSIYEDPTLRSGDAVMTKDGMKVFAGGRFSPDHPYGETDFVTVSTAKSVTPEMKKTVIELNKLPHG